MRILSRYVFREILTSALLGTFLTTFVIFLQQVASRLFELLVRSSASPQTVLKLFALALPAVLPLSIPFGVLVGILIRPRAAWPATARSSRCGPPASPASA